MAIPAFEGRRTRTGAYEAEFTPEEMEAIRQAEERHGYRDMRRAPAWLPAVQVGVELLRVPENRGLVADFFGWLGERIEARTERMRARTAQRHVQNEARRREARLRQITVRLPEVPTRTTPRFRRLMIAYVVLILLITDHARIRQLWNITQAHLAELRNDPAPEGQAEPIAHGQSEGGGQFSIVASPTPPSFAEIEAEINALPLREPPVIVDDLVTVQPPAQEAEQETEAADEEWWASEPNDEPSPKLPDRMLARVTPADGWRTGPEREIPRPPRPVTRTADDDREPNDDYDYRHPQLRKPSRLRRVFGAIGRGYLEITNLPFDLIDSEPE